MPDGIVCNPAFLPEQTEGLLLVRGLIGNGYTAMATANQLINEPITREFLQSQFLNQNPTSVEAHAGLAFTTKYFSAGFSPYRIQYVSEVHNPNFPVIAVHAALERSLVFSGGIPMSWASKRLKGFTLGAKARILQRRFVHGSFTMFQAVVDDPQTLLPIREHSAVFIDPSMGWVSQSLPWKLRGSVALTNLGKVWNPSPLYPEAADLALGIGVEPPVQMGRWRVGMDVVDIFRAADFFSRFRLGSSYKLGMMEAMAGINRNSLTAGMQFGIDMVQAGIVYEFVRDDFGGTSIDSRISTEVAFRL